MSTVSRAVELPLNQLDTYDTVFLDETRPDAPALGYIDQTLLPHRLVVRTISQLDDMVRAIKRLEVRGAPALGVSAAIGVYAVSWQLAHNAQDVSNTGVLPQIEAACDALANARPTAVNFSWAVEHMRRAARGCACESLDRLLAALRREAVTIRDEDVE